MLQAIARLYKQGLGPQTAASSEGTRDAASSETVSHRDEGSVSEQPQYLTGINQDSWQEGSTFLGALGIHNAEQEAQIRQHISQDDASAIDPSRPEANAMLSRSRSWVAQHSSLRKKRRTKQWNVASGRESPVPPEPEILTLPDEPSRRVTRSRTQRMPPKPKRFNPGEGLRRKPARASTRNKSQEAPEPQPLSADAALLLEALNSNGNPDARRQDDDRLAVLRDAFEAQEEASEATTTSDHEEQKEEISEVLMAEAWKEWEEKLKLLSPTGEPPPKPKMLIRTKEPYRKSKAAQQPATDIASDEQAVVEPPAADIDDSWNAFSKALEQRILLARQQELYHQQA